VARLPTAGIKNPAIVNVEMLTAPLAALLHSFDAAERFGPGSFGCYYVQLEVKVNAIKSVTMLEFRKDAQSVLRRIAKGERLVLSHRGKPAARLEPLHGPAATDTKNDPFLSIGRRATRSPKGKTRHADIDKILYGSR
jgi:antitoxin (DNA-binding transcriptional repressor) of toxin-antitoxin stability system